MIYWLGNKFNNSNDEIYSNDRQWAASIVNRINWSTSTIGQPNKYFIQKKILMKI